MYNGLDEIKMGFLFPSITNSSPGRAPFIHVPQNTGREIFSNCIESNRDQIVFTIFRLIWNQINVCLDPNQSQNGKYNLISGGFIKILNTFLCAQRSVWFYRRSVEFSMKLNISILLPDFN